MMSEAGVAKRQLHITPHIHISRYSTVGTVASLIFCCSQRRKVAKYDAEEAELLKKEQEAEASEEAITKRVNAAVEELLAARIALE